MGNTGTMVTMAIGGVVALVLAFITYPIMQSSADVLYLEFEPHCESDNESFLRLYAEDADDPGTITGSAINTMTSSNCTTSNTAITAALPTSGNALSEHGVLITTITAASTITAISDAEWVLPTSLLDQYSGISTLILSILPILAVIGFLGISAANIYQQGSGQSGGIQQTVTASIGGLLVVIVGLFLAPTVLDFAADFYLVSTDGRFAIMARFEQVIKLVTGFFPIIYLAGLLSLQAYQGVGLAKKFGAGGMSG